jgi:hypothetical protein
MAVSAAPFFQHGALVASRSKKSDSVTVGQTTDPHDGKTL